MNADSPPASDSRLGHVVGVVLCAGPASHVHALRFGEHTLAERAAALLAQIVHDVVWVGASPSPGAPGRAASAASVAALEAASPDAPLRAALEAAPDDSVLVVSADRPRLTPDLLIGLAGRPDAPAVVPRDATGTHLTCARYAAPAVLPSLRAGLRAGDGRALPAGIDVAWLEGPSLAALDEAGTALRRVASAAELEGLVAELGEDARLVTRGSWPGHPGLGLARSSHARAADEPR